ncbi:MAG: A/G-specific adenine glycosylase [Bacteroidota bacterium]
MHDFSLLIRSWYRQNGRSLPWRETINPYLIWLSEVILQQTRVDQGKAYYEKFVQHYPTVEDLARASEEEILNDWQGLGYYSRARNLHFAAHQIVNDFNGEFPDSYKGIKSLKGVGDYTAAAIASFAFNLPHAVVDGNVYRVLSRYFADATPIDSTQGKKLFAAYARELLPKDDPASFNQAIMELGALVCKPTSPDCEHCPVHQNCLAFREGQVQHYPVKKKKTKVEVRYFHYCIASDREMQIEQRTGQGIWKNMYQFPLIESKEQMPVNELKKYALEHFGVELVEKIADYKHILSHRKIYATFWRVNQKVDAFTNYTTVPIEKIDDYPLPRLIHRFLEENNNFYRANQDKK